ncbi:MAG: hypothetical protein QG652_16 [Pseudomonadota bacterium]|nr:hypothetical protein [Pseudomonadota bacterium]
MTADFFLPVADYLRMPASPALSWLIGLLLVLALLYAARRPVHRLLTLVFDGVNRVLRLLIRFLHAANRRLRQRNREVLLAGGREALERRLQQDFVKITDQVAHELVAWPGLHREMREHITHLDNELEKSAEQLPQPPEWLQVIESVAQVSNRVSAEGAAMVAKILQDIHLTLQQAMDKSLAEYRQANRDRYAMLERQVPQWRSLDNRLDDLQKTVTRLDGRTQQLDAHLQDYQQILQGTDRALAELNRSAAVKLLLSVWLLLMAAACAVVNFQLLALPLAEVVGVQADILGWRSPDVAAAAIIVLQIIPGLFFLEAAGATHLLPDMGLSGEHRRRGVMYLMLLLLLILAATESALIHTRDALVADTRMLNQLLAVPADDSQPVMNRIPALGQMVLGFVLPFLLMFAVVAAEIFLQALRTVAGRFLSWLLEGLEGMLRLLVALLRVARKVLMALYDLLIMLPLYLEHLLRQQKPAKPAGEKIAAEETDT